LDEPTITQLADLSSVLAEIQKLSNKVDVIGVLDATVAQYRHTLHERFDKLHLALGIMDESDERLAQRLSAVEARLRQCQASHRWLKLGLLATGLMALLALSLALFRLAA
jgi:hypothetical protein